VLADVPSPFDPLVALFACGAWPVGCSDGELRVLVWSSRVADGPDAGPVIAPDSYPFEEDSQIFLSAPFRERALSEAWRRALEGARLENAWWKRVDARGVDFYKASLVRAGLRQAFLSGAVLKKADLSNATLVDAQLDGADLTDADLRGANLRGANLAGAILKGAKLDRAILEGVDLTKAKDLTNIDLRSVKTDAKTVLPVNPAPAPPTP
jgi:Pentapeptide repeats (8 copies)